MSTHLLGGYASAKDGGGAEEPGIWKPVNQIWTYIASG
jgi:hypothetical protein